MLTCGGMGCARDSRPASPHARRSRRCRSASSSAGCSRDASSAASSCSRRSSSCRWCCHRSCPDTCCSGCSVPAARSEPGSSRPSASWSPSPGRAPSLHPPSWRSRCWCSRCASRSDSSTSGSTRPPSTLGASPWNAFRTVALPLAAARRAGRRGAVFFAKPRRVRRDDGVRRQHSGRDAHVAARDLQLHARAGGRGRRRAPRRVVACARARGPRRQSLVDSSRGAAARLPRPSPAGDPRCLKSTSSSAAPSSRCPPARSSARARPGSSAPRAAAKARCSR